MKEDKPYRGGGKGLARLSPSPIQKKEARMNGKKRSPCYGF